MDINNGLLGNPASLCLKTSVRIEHISFSNWLIKKLKISIFSKLGIHTGISYSTLCQSLVEKNLSTQSHTVDIWKSAKHKLIKIFLALINFKDKRTHE